MSKGGARYERDVKKGLFGTISPTRKPRLRKTPGLGAPYPSNDGKGCSRENRQSPSREKGLDGGGYATPLCSERIFYYLFFWLLYGISTSCRISMGNGAESHLMLGHWLEYCPLVY